MDLCSLCGVEEVFSRHHLIPKTVHSNKWFKKTFTREEMNQVISVCKGCHQTINQIDAKELGRQYNTREKLLEHPEVARYVEWRQKRRGGPA